MAERRKIIIQTGADATEPLPTPHFDAEATMTARPVVPLTDQEAYQMPYGHYAGRAAAAKPFWKRPALMALIVLVAVGIGVAAGLTIGIYRNRQTAETPVATEQTSPAEDINAGQMVEEPQPAPAEQARTVVPEETEKTEEAPVEDSKDVERREERTTRNERKDDDDDVERAPRVVAPPAAGEKKPVKVDEYEIEDEREARRAERRAERRERRRREREEEITIPRGIDRAGREVDRIREIFEGRQP